MRPSFIPKFEEGDHYRQQHPTKEANRKWRFVTLKDTRVEFDSPLCSDLRPTSFHSADGREWLLINRYGITLRAGYAWNGCTPKYWSRIFGWCGTPDYPSTILASAIHDALYQFARTEHFPFHRSDVDLLFYHIISLSGSPRLASLYYSAVVKFGRWSDKPARNEYSKFTA
jgi:hypothetical protein